MENLNLVQLWNAQNEKIDQTLQVNSRLLKDIVSLKSAGALSDLKRFKTKGIIAEIIYLFLLGSASFFTISHYSSAANYFIVSIAVIFLINIKALADYIKHLVAANRIDFNGSVTRIQQQLTTLQLSIFKHMRIMVLQLPFWTTFYLSSRWFPSGTSWGLLIFQLLMTGAFTGLALWLFTHLKIENAENKWIKMLIQGAGGRSVQKTIDFYREIEDFKTQDRYPTR